jgi:hypothetical protein
MSRLVVIAITVALLAIPAVSSTAIAATPKCDGLRATIVGTNGPDILKGTSRRDVIVSRGGADKIFGRGGNDVICTGSGRDTIVAGAGKDRVFGGRGKDTLKGGAGWDVLDGGPDKDACYKNADGAKLKNCEEADLRVTVTSPASVVENDDGTEDEDEKATFSVRVKNIGAKSAWYDLVVVDEWSNVTCSMKHSTTEQNQFVKPGAWLSYDYWATCEITGANPHVTMTATAKTTADDDDLSNNAAESRTDITPAP